MQREDSFRRGVSLSVYGGSSEEPSTKPTYGKFLDDIVDLGATDLELVVRWFQVDTKAIEIAPSALSTVEDELLTWLMDEANTRGLRVCLTPVLEIEAEGPKETRSAIEPEAWDRWWWSYERFVTHYARLAGTHKAALLSVGSDLTSTQSQTDRWRELVRDVRKVYRGKLWYSAAIDHVSEVGFWDAVDVVGVTGYQTALIPAAGSDEELRKAMTPQATKLRSWALAEGKRYLFTDLGLFTPGADRSKLLMDELRRQRTTYEVWQDDPRLEGMMAGAWLGRAPQVALPGVRERPAAEVLRHWYRASRVAAQGSILP
ncbi:MAG: hypothetical protein QM778_33810 [Myxococcales bacterium]